MYDAMLRGAAPHFGALPVPAGAHLPDYTGILAPGEEVTVPGAGAGGGRGLQLWPEAVTHTCHVHACTRTHACTWPRAWAFGTAHQACMLRRCLDPYRPRCAWQRCSAALLPCPYGLHAVPNALHASQRNVAAPVRMVLAHPGGGGRHA